MAAHSHRICKYCQKPFWSLKRHNQTQHGFVQCDICSERLRNDRLYKQHMKQVHPNILLVHRCKKCSAVYNSMELLSDHQATIHSSDSPFECSQCGAPFRTMFEVQNHLMASHTTNPIFALKQYQSKLESCVTCGTRTRDMFIHQREHHWDPDQPAPFECDFCPSRFKSRSKIASHMKNHVNEMKLRCDKCPKTFSHYSRLKRHSVIHLDSFLYQCEMCGISFKHSTSLKLHIKTHTGEKPYKCSMCANAYSTSNSLSLHLRIHLNERSYNCEICDWAFYDMSTLKVHRRQHSGENPFICHICRKSCKQASNLKSHYMHVHKNVHITGQEIRNNARIFALYSPDELRTGDLEKMLREAGPVIVTRGRNPRSNRIFPIMQSVDDDSGQVTRNIYPPDYRQYPNISVVEEVEEEPVQDQSSVGTTIKDECKKDNFTIVPSRGKNSNDSQTYEIIFIEESSENDLGVSSNAAYCDSGKISPLSAGNESNNWSDEVQVEIVDEKVDEGIIEKSPKRKRARKPSKTVPAAPRLVSEPEFVLLRVADRTYECYICKMAFRKRDNLKGHMMHLHLPKRQMCHQCGFAFATNNALRRHMISHSNDRPYHCTECSRSFKSQATLNAHSNTHTNEKRFNCSLCAKQFFTMVGLKLHQRHHTGEKPFGCDRCESRFSDPSTARQHRLIHTGELPYRCHLCDRGCTQVGNLKSHLRHFHKINVANVPLAKLKTLREPQ